MDIIPRTRKVNSVDEGHVIKDCGACPKGVKLKEGKLITFRSACNLNQSTI